MLFRSSGTFANQKDKQTILANKKIDLITELEKKIAALQTTLSQTTTVNTGSTGTVATGVTAGATGSAGNAALDNAQAEAIAVAQNAQVFATAVEQGINSARIAAANNGNVNQLNLVEVPGLSTNRGANINSAVTPKVVAPGKPKTQLSQQSVSSSELKKENNS